MSEKNHSPFDLRLRTKSKDNKNGLPFHLEAYLYNHSNQEEFYVVDSFPENAKFSTTLSLYDSQGNKVEFSNRNNNAKWGPTTQIPPKDAYLKIKPGAEGILRKSEPIQKDKASGLYEVFWANDTVRISPGTYKARVEWTSHWKRWKGKNALDVNSKEEGTVTPIFLGTLKSEEITFVLP